MCRPFELDGVLDRPPDTRFLEIQHKDYEQLMKKEIFDSLAKLSPQQFVGTSVPQMAPAVEISGELAFCLETLMTTVGQKMNLTPQSVLEKILTTGIESWVGQLSDHTKKSIGLSAAGAASRLTDATDWDDEDPDPARAQQAAYAQLTESYGYTPLTAHSMSKPKSGNGRGEQRNGGRKSTRTKKTRVATKSQPAKKHGSKRRRYAQNKMSAQTQ